MAEDESSTYAAGVVVIVACTLFNSSGMLLQRTAHNRIAALKGRGGERDATVFASSSAPPAAAAASATAPADRAAAAASGKPPLPQHKGTRYGTGAAAAAAVSAPSLPPQPQRQPQGPPPPVLIPQAVSWHLDLERAGSGVPFPGGVVGIGGGTPSPDDGAGGGGGYSVSSSVMNTPRSTDEMMTMLRLPGTPPRMSGSGGADAMPSAAPPPPQLGYNAGAAGAGDGVDGDITVVRSRRDELIARGWFCLSPWWVAGICAQVAGGLCAVGGIMLLGQARCAVFAGLTLMWSQAFATLFLKERFTWPDGAATGLIAAGSTLAAVYGAEGAGAAANPTFDAILAALNNDTAKVSGAVVGLLMGSLLGLLGYRRYVARTSSKSSGECILLAVTGGLFSCWASAGAKLVSSAFSTSLSHRGEVFTHWQAYVCVVGLAAALTCQIGFLNLALRRYDALSAIPPYECTLTLLGVAFGWLFLDEAAGVSRHTLGVFVLGSALCACGVLVLGLKPRLLAWRPHLVAPPPKNGSGAAGVSSSAAAAVEAVADCCTGSGGGIGGGGAGGGDDGERTGIMMSAALMHHGGGQGGGGSSISIGGSGGDAITAAVAAAPAATPGPSSRSAVSVLTSGKKSRAGSASSAAGAGVPVTASSTPIAPPPPAATSGGGGGTLRQPDGEDEHVGLLVQGGTVDVSVAAQSLAPLVSAAAAAAASAVAAAVALPGGPKG